MGLGSNTRTWEKEFNEKEVKTCQDLDEQRQKSNAAVKGKPLAPNWEAHHDQADGPYYLTKEWDPTHPDHSHDGKPPKSATLLRPVEGSCGTCLRGYRYYFEPKFGANPPEYFYDMDGVQLKIRKLPNRRRLVLYRPGAPF